MSLKYYFLALVFATQLSALASVPIDAPIPALKARPTDMLVKLNLDALATDPILDLNGLDVVWFSLKLQATGLLELVKITDHCTPSTDSFTDTRTEPQCEASATSVTKTYAALAPLSEARRATELTLCTLGQPFICGDYRLIVERHKRDGTIRSFRLRVKAVKPDQDSAIENDYPLHTIFNVEETSVRGTH